MSFRKGDLVTAGTGPRMVFIEPSDLQFSWVCYELPCDELFLVSTAELTLDKSNGASKECCRWSKPLPQTGRAKSRAHRLKV